MSSLKTAAALVVAVTVASCSASPTSPTSLPTSNLNIGPGAFAATPHLSATDLRIAELFASIARTFVVMGNLAQARADNVQVTQFALQQLGDNTLALQDLVNESNGEVRDALTLSPAFEQFVSVLGRESGSSFDSLYMDAMVGLLGQAVAIFRAQGPSASASLRDHAQSRAARMVTDLSMARDIAARVRGF